MSPSRLVTFALLLVASASFAPSSPAQITNVTDDTATPVEGAGHNYIKLLSETVNPSSGSLSLRIQLPVPQARGTTIPFSLAYDSNGVHHLVPGYYPRYGQVFWYSNTGYLAQGGWSYTIPQLSFSQFTIPDNVQTGFDGGPVYTTYNCFYGTNYTLREGSGDVHSLYLGAAWRDVPNSPQSCEGPYPAGGGDAEVSGALLQLSATGPGAVDLPVAAYDTDGTVYTFPTVTASGGNPITYYSVPSTIEDRNGNIVNLTTSGSGSSLSLVMTDTSGRPAVSIAGFGPTGTTNTITTPEGTYQITWTTTTASFSIPTPTWVGPSGSPSAADQCGGIPAVSDTQTVISQIILPNGQQYNFYYGSNPNPSLNNPYGLLSEIVYPSHGTVSYTWKLSDTQNELADYPGEYNAGYLTCSTDPYQVCPAAVSDGCQYTYQTPVVASRLVSFNGSSPALTQTFRYDTNWSGNSWTYKTTNVTTTDSIVNNNFVTAYTYQPITLPSQPFSYTTVPNQVAVEKTVQYYNWANSPTLLRTVTKSWLDQFRMQSQQTTLDNSQTSQINYTWSNDNITQKQEFDYGKTSPSRVTLTNYQTFSGTPGIILDRPCQIDTQDGNNNPYAETDYLYDGGSTTCGSAGTPSVTGVSNLPSDTHDETHFAPSSTTSRGNATTVTKKCFQSCSNATTTYTYDETGQALTSTDPKGNITHYSYADSYTTLSGGANVSYTPSASTDTYLTRITNPLGQTENFTYDYHTGELTILKDENSQITTYLYKDPFARPTQVKYPDGGLTALSYNDAPYDPSTLSPSVTTTKAITSATNMVSIAAADGLGHVVQTQLTTDPDGTDYAATIYNGLGSPYQTYNPTRCSTPTTNCGESTWGVTTTLYDALGRTCLLVPPDATPPTSNACPTTQPPDTVFTTYSGNTATVIDEAGNARESVTDALGRLKTVLEDPGSSPHLNYETDYAYTPLDDLQCVAQNNAGAFSSCTSLNASWRPRSFSYDSLSRLTSATNPESGTITYSYDANGNLVSKTSPAPNQTGAATVMASYSYDPLNRLTQKSFSDGTTPTVKYGYDATAPTGCTVAPPALTDSYPVGRRTAMCDGGGSESWSHDQMGRPLTVARTTNGITRKFPYTYNLDGSLNTLTYPIIFGTQNQTSSVTYTQGGAGRPLQLVSAGVTYITANAHYTPSGDLCYRQDDWDGAWTTTKTFNNRLQPVTIQSVQMFSGTPPPVCGISPIYSGGCCTSVLDLSYSFTNASGQNNGNVQRINNNLNMERTQLFTYDPLNRLSTAYTASTNQPWWQGDNPLLNCWGEQYTYDPWGNFTSISPISTAYTGCSQESLSMSPTTKNQLEDTNGDYVYDAAGNLTQPGPIGGPYVYDAENHLTSADGVTYTYDGDGNRVMKSNGTIYWYGANSASLEESDLSGNLQRWYYFFDGQRVGRSLTTNEVGFYMTDALGSVRYLGGSATGYRFDYFPFGAPILDSDTGDDRYQFTGKERDSESGLDNFGARYNSSSLGRFMTPDPLLNSGRPGSPQTWNRYAYALNNPLKIVDPTGLYNVDCGSDKTCIKAAKNLKNGLSDLQRRVDKMKDGTQKTRLENALKAMGTENDKNNVNVSFGATKGGGAGETVPVSDPQTYKESFNVTLDPGKLNGSNDYAIAGAHEGTHVDDFSTELANPNGQPLLSDFSLEYRGYQTSAYAASALGQDSLPMNYDGKSSVIWNGSWGAVDKNITNFVTSFHDKNGKPDHTETTPHNPWPN